jgi:hypothetical protein
MARRESGFAKRSLSFYPTPKWVVHALNEIIPLKDKLIWECACGSGEPADAIRECGGDVFASDIHDHGYAHLNALHDFLGDNPPPQMPPFHGIFTNPPYGERGDDLVVRFIERGLTFIGGGYEFVAFLLPTDFDHASGRFDLFDPNPAYFGQIKLTRRIKWFDHPVTCRKCAGTGKQADAITPCKPCKGTGEKKSSPSECHSIFIWQNICVPRRAAPGVFYAPGPELKVPLRAAA